MSRRLCLRQWIRHLLCPALGLLVIGYVIFEMDATAKKFGLIWLSIGIVYYVILTALMKRTVKFDL